MIVILGWMGLLVGCARPTGDAPPRRDDRWIAVEPGKDLCVPGYADEPLATRHERGLAVAREALRRGDLGRTHAALQTLPEAHGAVRATRAVAELLGDDAEAPARALVELVRARPSDPCLVSSAALALWAVGNRSDAARLLARARSLAPEEGHIAFLSWFLGLERASELRSALEAGLAEHPEHVGMGLALGVAELEQGAYAAALERLRAAAAARMAEADGPLLQASFRAGERADYLRVASRLGLPLGDEGALARAADPEAAYAELLGGAPGEPLIAELTTSEGTLRCTLRPDLAPVTVANFVGLARGTVPWRDPRTGAVVKAPLYPGTELHRVVPGFVVQGGDPLGTGTGGPGYSFVDEITEELRFDRAGRLAMANRGPNTNGSQFFVTAGPAPHIDGSYTIFGECDDASLETVRRITEVPLQGTHPSPPVVLHDVQIR